MNNYIYQENDTNFIPDHCDDNNNRITVLLFKSYFNANTAQM